MNDSLPAHAVANNDTYDCIINFALASINNTVNIVVSRLSKNNIMKT